MKPTLAGSMSVLHTWCGLLTGWIMFLAFLTGSASVFWMEIGNWGSPEVYQGAEPSRAAIIDHGIRFLAKEAPASPSWRIVMPNARDRSLAVAWEAGDEMVTRSLNPATGQAIRQSEGGWFFIHAHYRLNLMAGDRIGLWIIGVGSVGMLVALMSGILIHKRIIRDFFLFRWWSSRQRALTDAHNVLGVIALPFYAMIVLTGLAISATSYMPVGQGKSERVATPVPVESGDARPLDSRRLADATASIVEELDHRAGGAVVEYLYIDDPALSNASIRLSQQSAERVPTQIGRPIYDVQTSAVTEAPPRPPVAQAQFFLRGMHFAQFGGRLLQWLYFGLGLAGCGTMALGLILFTTKRHARAKTPGQRWLYDLIGRINVAAIAGPIIACAVYMWAMRLVPLATEDRPAAEISCFYYAWMFTALHALLRPSRKAWVEQLAVASVVWLAIPLADVIDPGFSLVAAMQQGELSYAFVEFFCVICGEGFLYLALRLKKSTI